LGIDPRKGLGTERRLGAAWSANQEKRQLKPPEGRVA